MNSRLRELSQGLMDFASGSDKQNIKKEISEYPSNNFVICDFDSKNDKLTFQQINVFTEKKDNGEVAYYDVKSPNGSRDYNEITINGLLDKVIVSSGKIPSSFEEANLPSDELLEFDVENLIDHCSKIRRQSRARRKA